MQIVTYVKIYYVADASLIQHPSPPLERFFTSMLAASCWVAGMALVTESAPATERGMAGAGFQLAMVIGWMTCKVAATWTSDETMALSGWRLLTGLQIALAFLELAALCRVPESAKYVSRALTPTHSLVAFVIFTHDHFAPYLEQIPCRHGPLRRRAHLSPPPLRH